MPFLISNNTCFYHFVHNIFTVTFHENEDMKPVELLFIIL